MKALFAAAASLMLVAPANAQVTGTTGAGSQIATGQSGPEGKCTRGATVNGERCQCRRIPSESSRRLSLRNVCMTPTQWKEWNRNQ